MTHNNTFGLILDIVYETMPRDNLLNSACLELFEFIKRENIKPIVLHIVEKYGEKLKNITYVDTFRDLVLRYEQMQGYGAEADSTLFSQDDATSARLQANGQRWQGVKEMDAAEEEYFNTSDDEEEVNHSVTPRDSAPYTDLALQWQQQDTPAVQAIASQVQTGGASPVVKPLVDYPDDDEDDDAMDTKSESGAEQQQMQHEDAPQQGSDANSTEEPPSTPVSLTIQTPPERLSEKRRREDEDDDELIKLTSGPKRRSSTSSGPGSAGLLRKKRSTSIGSMSPADKANVQGALGNLTGGVAPKKIAINLGSAPNKSSQPGTDRSESTTHESSEKENRSNDHGNNG